MVLSTAHIANRSPNYEGENQQKGERLRASEPEMGVGSMLKYCDVERRDNQYKVAGKELITGTKQQSFKPDKPQVTFYNV